MNKKKICIIIPCYNELGNLPTVLKNLSSHMPHAKWLFIDDSSRDGTSDYLRKHAPGNATVITLPNNLGIGGAVQTGLIYAARNDFDYAVKFDGDGQHLAEEIELLLKPLFDGTADLTIGSRFLTKDEGFKSSFMRRIGIRCFRILSTLLTGQTITDNTSGFRAYNKKALYFAAEYYPAFDYPEPEEVILFIKNDFAVKEVPVKMALRVSGKSSIGIFKSIYYMLKVIFSICVTALRSKVSRTQIK